MRRGRKSGEQSGAQSRGGTIVTEEHWLQCQLSANPGDRGGLPRWSLVFYCKIGLDSCQLLGEETHEPPVSFLRGVDPGFSGRCGGQLCEVILDKEPKPEAHDLQGGGKI